MKTTTTVHWNKETVAEEHILRDEELCSREAHIDLYNEQGESMHEILFHKELAEVYEEEFGEALSDYNAKQKRKDRQMSMADYMKSVENDNRGKAQTKRVNGKRVVNENASRQGKQLSYEITVKTGNTYRAKDEDGRTIYDKNDHHIRLEELPRQLQRRIIYKYADGFQDRNPNFRLVNLCYHGDEGFYNKRNVWEYSEDHLHIEFVPIAHGFKRGLAVQNSMNKAMLEMGFDTPDCYELWAKKEQAILDEITRQEYLAYCEEQPDFGKTHGQLTIYHPVSERSRNGGKSKEELAREEELDESIAEVEFHKKKNNEKSAELADREQEIYTREQVADKKIEKALISIQLYDKEYESIEKYKQMVDQMKKASDRKIAALDAADLDNEFFQYIKRTDPEEFDRINLKYKEFRIKLKKKIEVPDLRTPKRVRDGESKDIRDTTINLQQVQADYEVLQKEDQELRKERKLIRRAKKPRALPEIEKGEKKIGIEGCLNESRNTNLTS